MVAMKKLDFEVSIPSLWKGNNGSVDKSSKFENVQIVIKTNILFYLTAMSINEKPNHKV
jgi:hypothetical protein